MVVFATRQCAPLTGEVRAPENFCTSSVCDASPPARLTHKERAGEEDITAEALRSLRLKDQIISDLCVLSASAVNQSSLMI
jgi:hypothetical protein